MSAREFIAYCWTFYGPRQLHGEFFGHALTIAELRAAVALRMTSPDFEGDSIDREYVREILLASKKNPLV